MRAEDLGTIGYNQAWAYQERVHEQVLAGAEERLLLLEHPPVITLGRRPGVDRNLIASAEQLASMGVELVQSDRGGDITFHGPGQLVIYPIVRLADHRLSVGGYVRRLEETMIGLLGELGVAARKDEAGVGVWVDPPAGAAAKIAAIGVRIRRGVSIHGVALNVSTDLRYFNLIVPCGLQGKPVTSLAQVLGDAAPTMAQAKMLATEHFTRAFAARAAGGVA